MYGIPSTISWQGYLQVAGPLSDPIQTRFVRIHGIPHTSVKTFTMQNAVRRVGLLSKGFPPSSLTRRLFLRRAHSASGPSQQAPWRQNAGLVLTGTALLSATAGYLLAAYGSQKSEVDESSLDYPQYGTAKDFRDAIEELKATFPKPGAVSDDPRVLEPYGSTDADRHPGKACVNRIDLC